MSERTAEEATRVDRRSTEPHTSRTASAGVVDRPLVQADVWDALSKIRRVKLRCSTSSDGILRHAGITLYGEFNCQRGASASFTARLKQGETLEAMVWRAIVELQRRELDGNPKPSPKVVEQRKLRKLLHTASGNAH